MRLFVLSLILLITSFSSVFSTETYVSKKSKWKIDDVIYIDVEPLDKDFILNNYEKNITKNLKIYWKPCKSLFKDLSISEQKQLRNENRNKNEKGYKELQEKMKTTFFEYVVITDLININNSRKLPSGISLAIYESGFTPKWLSNIIGGSITEKWEKDIEVLQSRINYKGEIPKISDSPICRSLMLKRMMLKNFLDRLQQDVLNSVYKKHIHELDGFSPSEAILVVEDSIQPIKELVYFDHYPTIFKELDNLENESKKNQNKGFIERFKDFLLTRPSDRVQKENRKASNQLSKEKRKTLDEIFGS